MMNRRQLLSTTAGMALAVLESGSVRATDRISPQASGHPVDLLTAYVKLGASLDDRLTIWWMDGVRYGVVDRRAQILYGMKVGLFQRFFPQEDGSYKLAMFELTYYTDLVTGELLEDYENPFTGVTNHVQHVRLGPEIRQVNSQGDVAPKTDVIENFSSRLGPPLFYGDGIWISSDIQAEIKLPFPNAPELRMNHYLTLHGKRSEVEDPSVVSAPASLSFHNIISWEPWMRMGDHPGHLMSQAFGRKLESLDELPGDYLTMARKVHPKFIEDPVATLDARVQKIVDETAG